MRIQMPPFLILLTLSFHGGDASSEDLDVEPKLVPEELSPRDRLNLIAAPQVFLCSKPSDALAQALTDGTVETVRADRLENDASQAVQGWLYYPEVDGYQPIVLCISETFPVIDWMHCQEEYKGRFEVTLEQQALCHAPVIVDSQPPP